VTRQISDTMEAALHKAATRRSGKITPIPGSEPRSTMRTLHAMDRHGFVRWEGASPRLSESGRAWLQGGART
jgi:hypothetical protein